MKKRIAGALSLIGLIGAYWVVRYPLFSFHHMKEWPLDLLIFGVIVIAVSGLIRGRKLVPICTFIGYGVGFVLGYLFQFDYGRELNSLWLIWTIVYLAVMLVGAAADFFGKVKIR